MVWYFLGGVTPLVLADLVGAAGAWAWCASAVRGAPAGEAEAGIART